MNIRSTLRAKALPCVGGLLLLIIAFCLWSWLPHSQVKGDVTSFSDTEIIVHPDVPLVPNKNVIWCGALALAWNETIKQVGGDLQHLESTREADLLNRQEFTEADLDPQSYVVMAGSKANVEEKFRDEIKKRFGDDANPPKFDSPNSSPGDLTVLAYLYKNLTFPTPFNENVPFWFDWKRIANFGFGSGWFYQRNLPTYKLTEQVTLLSYVSEDNFVIQLKTKGDEDQVVLAKIPPGKTLQETIQSVLPSISSRGNRGNYEIEALAVPKIDFDLSTHFRELENQPLKSGARISTAAENLVFRLDQNGVKLKAFAEIELITGMSDQPPTLVRLIFDKPFLVLMKRVSSPRPYFAMWIGNPTLLVSP